MFKKKKKKKNSLERKITKHFRNNPEKEYNYKQVAAVLEIKDTKTRNEIIKILNSVSNDTFEPTLIGNIALNINLLK